MFHSKQTTSGFVRTLARWWREYAGRRSTVAALADWGPAESARIAHDVGLSGAAELRVLAGKWPHSADLLARRMQQIKLDAAEIVQVEPEVVRDLERVCTLCASKRRCGRDFAKERPPWSWQAYCPNTMTLKALIAEHSAGVRTTG
jgi:glycerol-3-phosphate dehydrogenase